MAGHDNAQSLSCGTAMLPLGACGRLERLCKVASGGASGHIDRIRIASGAEGIERLEAHLHGQAFSPHRHDTYAIGITLAGIQTFHFRGEQWHCLPGQCHILHPDEAHDGAAGTDKGFRYRIVYIDPRLVREALPGRALPFIGNPVVDAERVPRHHRIWNFDEEIDDLARTALVLAIVDLLLEVQSEVDERPHRLALGPLNRVRDFIAATPASRHSMQELECLSGLDRWTLTRQFQAAFGTNPRRFRTMRQLDQVRRLLMAGRSLVEAAMEAGFADQSHMSRRFKAAYGLKPGEWISTASEAAPTRRKLPGWRGATDG
jgi:AraC-like DNA-binding protein